MKKQIIAFTGLGLAGFTTAATFAEAAATAATAGQAAILTYAAVAIGCSAMVYGFGRVMQLKTA